MKTEISDLPSTPATTGVEANTETVTPISNRVTDEMITELENYCNKFGQEKEDISQFINLFCQKNTEYVARHPNSKALLQLVAKRKYWKIKKEEKKFVPMERASNKALRAMEENNDHEEEDERISQVFNLASAPLKTAIKYVLEGFSFSEAAGKIGMSESQLCQHLARLGGRNKNWQPELFWEKAG